jgi:uncharacterized protein YndB with AHSA1/START domain
LTELELLAPRGDVWGFLAEPGHLADWWPGIVGVHPDRRGFAPGARWAVRVRTSSIWVGRREVETMLLVRDVEPYERWSWHLLSQKTDVEIRLRAAGAHTIVALTASGRTRRFEATALGRLYDLCQTAASL